MKYSTAKVLTVGMVLGLSLGMAFAGASPVQRVHAAGSFGDPLSADSARAAMQQGVRFETEGRLDDADTAYRRAWWTDEAREDAAGALRILHDRTDFNLPVDEGSVAETLGDLGDGYRRSETQHFVVLSNTTRNWTAARSRLLERTYHEFFRVMDRMGYPAHPPKAKLLCVLIKDHGTYERFAKKADGVHAGWVAGYYAGLSNRVVLYDDMTGPAFESAFAQLDQFKAQAKQSDAEGRVEARRGNKEQAKSLRKHASDLRRHEKKERKRIEKEAREASESKMIHEAVHLIAFNSGVQSRAHEYPFWLTEGLAMSFETNRPNAAFGPDTRNKTRNKSRDGGHDGCFSEGHSIPLGDLIGVSEATEETSSVAETLYCQTSVLFDHLYADDREAVAGLFAEYLEQPAGDLNAGKHVELFESQIGEPIAIEARLGGGIGTGVVARVSVTPSDR